MILMKQKQSVEGVKLSAKPSIKKVGTMLGAGAMAVLTIGAVSVFGIANRSDIPGKETETATECKTSAVQTSAEEREPVVTTASSATISWWKAGVEEYDFVEKASATTTTTKKTTTTTTTTTAEETTTTTAKKTAVKAIDSKIMYAAEELNMRKGPSKNNEVITVLPVGAKVNCTGKTDDGWYRVEYNGTTGYCMAEYLTSKKPAVKTTKITTTTAKATTAVASAAKKTTTSAAASNSTAAVSYSDEEFEMMCYVLQSEVGGCSEKSKIAVANVIINRVKSSRFPNTIKGVLTSPGQFTAITSYYNRTNPPTQNTIDCARRALNGEGSDAINGATYYYAPRYCSGSTASWFESLTFCAEFEGQRFFKS